VMMPSVLKYNKPATAGGQELLAEALHAPEADVSETFRSFISRLGLPGTLSEVGVSESQFALIGKNAMLSIFTRTNPQPIKTPDDVVTILKMAA